MIRINLQFSRTWDADKWTNSGIGICWTSLVAIKTWLVCWNWQQFLQQVQVFIFLLLLSTLTWHSWKEIMILKSSSGKTITIASKTWMLFTIRVRHFGRLNYVINLRYRLIDPHSQSWKLCFQYINSIPIEYIFSFTHALTTKQNRLLSLGRMSGQFIPLPFNCMTDNH